LTRSNLLPALLAFAAFAPAGPAQEHVFALVPRTELAGIAVERMIGQEIAKLNAGGPDAREQAREAVRRLGWRAAVPLLQREIRPGKNQNRCVSALLALDGIGGEDAVLLLRRVLFDEKFGDRERLAAALVTAKAGGRSASRLLADAMRLSSLKDDVRIGLALAATRLGDRGLIAAVRRLAPRPVRPTPVWAAVTLALAELGAPDPEASVRVLGRSGSPRIRRAACLAAARLEDRGSLAVLAESLRFERNDPGTTVCGVVALGIRRPDGARTQLIKALESSEELIRAHAALALGWEPDQRVTQVLKSAFATDRRARVRAAVVRALARHRDATLLATALGDASPEVRIAAMLLAVHAEREQALRAIDERLARETDPAVVATGLSVRLAVAGRPLAPDHRLRGAGAVNRVLSEAVWRDLDRYREEPGAPAWRWALAIHRREQEASGPERVRGRLLDAVMLELLDLMGEFEMPERRVVGNRSARPSVVVGPGRARAAPNFDRIDEDLKVWLQRRPFFAE
jgi:HEAT repeat protein